MKLKKFKERDHKRIGIIIFTIACIMLVSGVILYRTFAIFEVKTNQNVIKGKVGDMGDIQFAFYIDNQIVKSIPNTKENYVFDEENSNCTNGASVFWDYQVWGPTVSNLKETKTKCYLKFKTEYSEEILNGAVPKLTEELTPVTIDENGTVRKADVTTEWYNYGGQRWANAVILEENSRVIKDLSGNNNHGTLFGGTFTEEGLELDGVDDYITLSTLPLSSTTELSIEMTAKINNLDQALNIIEFSKDFNSNDNALLINLNESPYIKNIGFNIHKWAGYNLQSTENNILDSNMNQYYFTINTKNANKAYYNAYINSKKYPVTNARSDFYYDITNMEFPDYPMYVASRGGTKYFLSMVIQDLKIYTREIQENEIVNQSVSDDKLILHYDFTKETTLENNEIIPESSIESYFVWIPRYKYQIWNGEEETNQFTGVENLGVIEDATKQDELNKQKEIKIEFENKHMPISDGTLKNECLPRA